MKRIYVGVAIVLLLLIVPFTLWHMKEKQPLAIAIIDKSVSTDSYREHLGLHWLLATKKTGNRMR